MRRIPGHCLFGYGVHDYDIPRSSREDNVMLVFSLGVMQNVTYLFVVVDIGAY